MSDLALAQNEIIEDLDFENAIERLFPQQEIELDYNDAYDRLFSHYTNPLDLNRAERTEFQTLFFLTEEQINRIIEYRNEYKNFLSVFELLSIEGFDKETVERLIPFIVIYFGAPETLKTSLKYPDIHELFLRYQTTFEQKKGYTSPDTSSSGDLTSRYAGGPGRLYARYLCSKPGSYSVGFTIEKDPGEKINWDPESKRYGMDYYSFHAMIEKKGVFKKIILGDYSMDYGQGLIFGSGLSFGKGTETITTIRRNNYGLKPYRSVFENKDFSGVAVSTQVGPLGINVFYSHVKRDAIIRADTISDLEQYISSIQTIGLHRTPTEIAAKNELTDQSIGGNLNFKSQNKKIEIGLNGIYTDYNVSVLSNQKSYNQFGFAGKDNYVGSFYMNYYLKKAHLFGEMAYSKSGGKAISSGIIASLSSQVQASLHIRKYDHNFHSFYGAAFGENSKIGNENGVYWGLKINPILGLNVSTYLDLFSFPWLKYQIDKPSRGHDYMISGDYQANSNLNFRIHYRNKSKETNVRHENQIGVQILPKTTNRLSLNIKYTISSSYSLQTRVQHTKVKLNNTESLGFIVAQDLHFHKPKYSLSARFALFDTDDYDSRQFIYERDVLYLYNIPSFYNKGVRYYLLVKYKLTKRIELWLKYSQTKYTNQEKIGSGLEEINGDVKTTLNAQVRIKL